MSLLEKSVRLTSPEILSATSSAPSSRLSSPALNPVDVGVGTMVSVTTSSDASVISVSSSGMSTHSSTGSVLLSEVDSSGRRSPSLDKPVSSDTFSRSPSLSTDLDGSNASSIVNQLSDPDPQIMEALRSKDRLYVLKLGELMEGLINDRRQRIETNPSTSYQRLLVHRCSAYYGLRPESDSVTKAIYVWSTTESRIPVRRICELVPAETKFQPAFKIMARNSTNQRSKPHSQAGSVTGEDNDSSDIEPSEAGSLGGRSNATGSSMKKRPTIEEREAAYNQARSRIFMDFEEKEKDKGISASSSTASLVSGSGSASGGGRSSASDGDEAIVSPVTESERSAPVVRDRDKQRRGGSKRGSGNNSVASSSRSMRSSAPPYSGSGPSSSRGSRAASPSTAFGGHYEQGGPAPYDLYNAPYAATSPGTEYPPQVPYPYPPYPAPPPGQQYYPYPQYYPQYPYPPPQPSEPLNQGPPNSEGFGTHSPVPPMVYGHPPYGWPPNMPPPPHLQPPPPHPMNHPQHPIQSPHHGPNPLPPFPPQGPSPQNEHPLPPQHIQNPPNNLYGYMPAPYPYPSPYYHQSHHPLQPPVPPAMPQQHLFPPHPMNGIDASTPNINDHVTNSQPNSFNLSHISSSSSNSSVNHSRASSRSSMSSGLGNGGKGRGNSIPPLTRGPWSYGPGTGPTSFQPPYGTTPSNDAFGPRLSNRRTSMSSSGYGSRDESSSTASSSTSSSSRRTYTSTASSQHPLPARPDWAVGLKPQPTLASANHGRHHEPNNRKVSPVSPPRGQSSNGARQHHQPILHSADFPPLSNSERETRAPAIAGAWTDSSPIRAAIPPQRGPISGPGGSALVHYSTSATVDATNVPSRLEDTERGFERPPPKGSAELYNPKSPRKIQSPFGSQHAAIPDQSLDGNFDRFSSDAILSSQVNSLSLNDQAGSGS